MSKELKDLLLEAFVCEECSKLVDNSKKIILRYDTEKQMFFKKPKEVCYTCAVTRQEAI